MTPTLRLTCTIAIGAAAVGAAPRLGAQLVERPARVEVTVPASPIPAYLGGKRALVYELHITNLGAGALRLMAIDVYRAGGGRGARPGAPAVASYRDTALAHVLAAPAMRDSVSPARLEPEQRTGAFLWLTFPDTGSLPSALRHRLTFEILDSADVRRDGGTESVLDSILVKVSAVATPLLQAPLRGGVWLAAGPANGSDHRRSITAIGGRAYLAQRFAIDWQKLGPNENTYHGDGHHNADYWSYGEPIISVAAGEVVAALDTVHENTPHEPLPRMPFANLAGNFVTVRIAGNRYVTYAHLRLGSVRVRVHDHVAAGQLLGLLGNSGQATAPHLHFQVTDGPSVLGAGGVPFRLTTFRHVGFGATYEPGAKHEDVLRRGEMPADDEIVRLP